MYNIDINVEYNDNATYRQCLRQVMNMDVSEINFDQYGENLEDETKDELLIDENRMSMAMDDVYAKTKHEECFQSLYTCAAGLMFSTDPQIGLAVLFSYDYFSVFHVCIQSHYNNNHELFQSKVEQLRLMLQK